MSVVKSLVGGVLGNLLLPKAKAQPQPQPLPQVQQRPNSAAADALAARRGSRANKRTGRGGGEPSSPGGKTKLGG